MPRTCCSHPAKQLNFNLKQGFGAVVSRKLNATTGAALLGTDPRLLNQEFRRLLEPAAGPPEAGSRQLGFRELLYFELISSLGEQGLQLSPKQKQEVYGLLVRPPGRSSCRGRCLLSLDLSAVGRDIRNRYRLVKRPHSWWKRIHRSARASRCSGAPGSRWRC